MALIDQQLYADILDTLIKVSKKKFKTPLDSQKFIAQGITKAVSTYIRNGDVTTVTNTPNIKTMVGTSVASNGSVTPAGVVITNGKTTTTGILVEGTGVGSGTGKVV